MPHLNFAAMGRTKSIATQMAKGERVRMESLEPTTRNRFGGKEKHKRYEEIKNWAFIPERKVQFLSKQYDPLLGGCKEGIG